MKRILAGLMVLALATVVWGNPQLYNDRWQDRAGRTLVDSLGWRAGGHGVATGRLYDSNIDTLTAAKSDTTPPYRIDGCDAIAVSPFSKKTVLTASLTYTVQVSDDTIHWAPLTTTFTFASSSTAAAKDSTAYQCIYTAIPVDSAASSFGINSDRRRVAAATWIRFIVAQAAQTGNDTAIHCEILKRRFGVER